ncbi:hypothetical protein [Photobacterium leiognathi]|uniref:hypothetical protein n=1 Tax=Photobacterium leiognathi TaxID=553611 RepID=UPI00273A3CEF|nr:hypothetical protein [Photobacterium leiognathi]
MLYFLRFFLITFCILFSSLSLASNQDIHINKNITKPNDNKALVAFNVGVDLSGIEQPANIAAQSIEKMAASLQTMAKHPNLTPEQQTAIIDTLAQTFNQSVAALPKTVAQTSTPIITASKSIMSDIKLYTILFFALIIILIVLALIAIYYFVLAPIKNILLETTGKLNHMADALETTANLVHESNQFHREILHSIHHYEKQQKEHNKLESLTQQ